MRFEVGWAFKVGSSDSFPIADFLKTEFSAFSKFPVLDGFVLLRLVCDTL
jgi:hypothetical protein